MIDRYSTREWAIDAFLDAVRAGWCLPGLLFHVEMLTHCEQHHTARRRFVQRGDRKAIAEYGRTGEERAA